MSGLYKLGDEVTAVKALRQDGTYPDPLLAPGAVLVPAGTVGQVIDIGSYLQRHVIYAVAFRNGRVVGCLGNELDPIPLALTTGGGGAPA